MSGSYFEQYIQYRLLDFKFSTICNESSGMESLLDKHFFVDENPEIKQVCAKLPIQLVDKMDSTVNKLDISKRKFIEMAIIDAINKVDNLEREVDLFEFADDGKEASYKESEK